MLSNCGAGEDSWETLGQLGNQTNLKRNQPWILIGRTDAEAETPILWQPDGKSRLIGKDPDAGKDWRQEEKGMTEDEMVGWHHQCNGHKLGQTPADGEGQGSLTCWSPWGCKEVDTTWQLNSNSNNIQNISCTLVPTHWNKYQCMYLIFSLRPLSNLFLPFSTLLCVPVGCGHTHTHCII